MPVPQIQGVSSVAHIPNSQKRRNSPQKVFVYGTLKKGYHNHEPYLKEAKYLGTAEVQGIMFHLGGFPAINLAEHFGTLHGEVYEVNWDHIIHMDKLEGVGHNFYDRAEVRVKPHGLVWTYYFPRDRAVHQRYVVPTGIWVGRYTPQVKWLGFGKGVAVEQFTTDNEHNTIEIKGSADGNFILRLSPLDGTYKLIDKRTDTVIGSYKHLRDMVGTNGTRKPVLRLPATLTVAKSPGTGDASLRTVPDQVVDANPAEPQEAVKPLMEQLVDAAVQAAVKDTKITPLANVPVVIIPDLRNKKTEEPPKKEDIPQAARLMGIKYGGA